jgi:hypothetical protein
MSAKRPIRRLGKPEQPYEWRHEDELWEQHPLENPYSDASKRKEQAQ